MESKKVLNDFLVDTFNEILRLEQTALENLAERKLSISEIHVIEAVFKALEKGTNTAGEISRMLKITLGSLTVAVQTLEKKGYLYRQRNGEDKRIVRIFPTPLGELTNKIHMKFHDEMVNDVTTLLNDEEQRVLIVALGQIKTFFERKALKNKQTPGKE